MIDREHRNQHVKMGRMLNVATGWILLRGSGSWDWRGGTLALLAAAIIFRTKVNPVWVIAAGAAAGVAGLI